MQANNATPSPLLGWDWVGRPIELHIYIIWPLHGFFDLPGLIALSTWQELQAHTFSAPAPLPPTCPCFNSPSFHAVAPVHLFSVAC